MKREKKGRRKPEGESEEGNRRRGTEGEKERRRERGGKCDI